MNVCRYAYMHVCFLCVRLGNPFTKLWLPEVIKEEHCPHDTTQWK